MYEYHATVTNVVDGDTYDVIVDLGFKITMGIRVRLKNIDTPETWRPKTEAERAHGVEASDFVEDLIFGEDVTVRTHKLGIYGRYSADVILSDGRDLATLIKEAGLEKKDSYE